MAAQAGLRRLFTNSELPLIFFACFFAAETAAETSW
jgi:hypothetical protein